MVGISEPIRPSAASRGTLFSARAAPPATMAAPLARTASSGLGSPSLAAFSTRAPGERATSSPDFTKTALRSAWPMRRSAQSIAPIPASYFGAREIRQGGQA